jgi:hypothetical protein
MGRWIGAASLVLAIGAAIFVLVWPMYASFGMDGSVTRRATLLEVNGSWAVVPVLFPVALASMSLLFRRQAARVVAAVLMGAFALLGGMTIGFFYLPAAIAMVLAACVPNAGETGRP